MRHKKATLQISEKVAVEAPRFRRDFSLISPAWVVQRTRPEPSSLLTISFSFDERFSPESTGSASAVHARALAMAAGLVSKAPIVANIPLKSLKHQSSVVRMTFR